MSKKILLGCVWLVAILVLSGCANKANKRVDPVVSVLTECKTDDGVVDWSIIEIPSYGLIPDAMAGPVALKGNDGGFSKDIKNLIAQDNKNIAVISKSRQKLKFYIQHMLEVGENDEYKDINFCIIGVEPDDVLLKEQKRTKAKIQWKWWKAW